MTWWKSHPEFCCGPCGEKAKSMALASSMVLGWWGFPWGIIWTPIQVGRNVTSLLGPDTSLEPSPDLVKLVKRRIAASAHAQA